MLCVVRVITTELRTKCAFRNFAEGKGKGTANEQQKPCKIVGSFSNALKKYVVRVTKIELHTKCALFNFAKGK